MQLDKQRKASEAASRQSQPKSAPKHVKGRTTSIPDGDGFTLFDGVQHHQCRLAWLDAPEMSQRRGPIARAVLYYLLKDHEIECTFLTIDKYRRNIVSVVRDDGLWINLELIRLGAAFYEPRYGKGDDALAYAQQDAQRTKIGIWEDSVPERPVKHRHTKNALLRHRRR